MPKKRKPKSLADEEVQLSFLWPILSIIAVTIITLYTFKKMDII